MDAFLLLVNLHIANKILPRPQKMVSRS